MSLIFSFLITKGFRSVVIHAKHVYLRVFMSTRANTKTRVLRILTRVWNYFFFLKRDAVPIYCETMEALEEGSWERNLHSRTMCRSDEQAPGNGTGRHYQCLYERGENRGSFLAI